jgi:hypothetical protein
MFPIICVSLMVQVKKIIERIGSLIENTIEGRKQNNKYQRKNREEWESYLSNNICI